jgi:endopolyphosphatase
MRFEGVFAAALFVQAYAAPPAQVPLKEDSQHSFVPDQPEDIEKKRPLHGRFLQITGKR